MSTFYPLSNDRPEKRPVYVIVPTEAGFDFHGADVVYSFEGRERCNIALRACAGVSRADGGGKMARQLDAGAGETKPALVTTAPYTDILDRVGYAGWVATRRHSRFTSLRLPMGRAGVNITLLPASPHPPAAFFSFLGWGSRYGMKLAGLGSMGAQLWRSTLIMPAVLNGFREPGGDVDALGTEVARQAYYGARKEAPFPFRHDGAVYWDMTSAYPSALGAAPLATGMVETTVDRRHTFPADTHGFALARVSTDPPSPWSPLPARVSGHSYMFGHFRETLGAWSLRDLACARDRGDYVYVERMWLPAQESGHIFGPGWLSLVREARGLPGPLRWWAKRCLNACWGTFAIDPQAAEKIEWADDAGLTPATVEPSHTDSMYATPVSDTPLADTLYVAAEVTARCRQRLWDDALRTDRALYVDTDGVILPAGVTPAREGADLGSWTAREHMARVEIRAPGVYRFRRADDAGRGWHYVTSGVPNNPDSQRWLFERHGEGVVHGGQAYGGDQLVLPPGDVAEAVAEAAA